MYCSTEMPNPQAAAGPSMPADLDDLVRAALTGGRIDKLKAALEAPREAPQEPAPLPLAAVEPVASGAPVAAQPAAPSIDPDAAFDTLAASAARARASWKVGDAAAAARALSELEAALGAVRSSLGAPAVAPHPAPAGPAAAPPPPDAGLPRYRLPWLLIVDGPGDAGKARPLAAALDIDLPTARQAALAPFPRVVLRGDERLPLDRKAGRVQAMVGVRAKVRSREELAEMDLPALALAAGGPHRVETVRGAAWLGGDVGALRPGVDTDCSDALLAVPGDVVVRHYRVGADRRGSAVRPGAERRVAVLDLHGPDTFVRIVQGVTELRGWPGHDAHSTLRSMRQLTQKLWAWWPAAKVLAPRTCRPGDPPTLEQVSAEPDGLEVGGWPEWEEHTRLCRVLAEL